MNTRPAPDETDWSATVAVRVPQSDDGDLATAASRRLAAREGINAIDVVALQAIEPALAATVVRLQVQFAATACLESACVRERLGDAPGVQRVDELRPA